MHTKKEHSSGEIILYGIGFLVIIVLIGSVAYYAVVNRKKNNKKTAEKGKEKEEKTKQCPIKYENSETSVTKPTSSKIESTESSERSEKSETPIASSEAPKKSSTPMKNDASSLELVVPPEQVRKPLSKEESKEKFDNSKEVVEKQKSKEYTAVDMEPKSHTGSKSKSTSKEQIEPISPIPNQAQNAPVVSNLQTPNGSEIHHSGEISSQRSEMSTFNLKRAGSTPPQSPLPSSEFSSTPNSKTSEALKTVVHKLSSETTIDLGTPTKPK